MVTVIPRRRPRCTVGSCNNPMYSKGWCQYHYYRAYKNNGDPIAPRKKKLYAPRAICCVDGCVKVSDARGMCSTHYNRWRRYDNPHITKKHTNKYGNKLCGVEECSSQAKIRGYCRKHADKHDRYGDPRAGRQVGTRNPSKNKHGYIRVYHPEYLKSYNGWVLEHIWVMSQHLGRPLVRGENVHHKNGVRDDNRLSNLELWVVSQPAGQRPVDLVEWAWDIIERYGSTVVTDAAEEIKDGKL